MERRLAAILAADVVGYSRLMAADEKGTHARLKALRQDFIEPKVADHQGRIVKLLGDGALVEFASVVDAVECAAAIQQGVAERQAELPEDQRIAFRIGINIGDIIIEDDDIYGDGVNIAARLEALVEPGGVCVARNVYNQVKNKVAFGFEPMGEHAVKNIPERVIVYRLVTDPGPVARAIGLKRPGTPRWRWAGGAVAAAVLVVLGVAGWLRPWEQAIELVGEGVSEATALDTRRIAVLPFDNISASDGDAYFADGMTEELIAQLSKIGELSVIARTSILRYQDTDKGVEEIGRELGVGTILEGSIRKAGDQVRITTQLIDVASQAHLWSETYDRPFENIFTIQSDIAEQVSDALHITLLPETVVGVETSGTKNPEAYDAYLQGLYFWNRRTAEGARKAERYFKKAIALDPNFAAAHAKLSENYWHRLEQEFQMSPQEVAALARQLAEKAIELNPDLPEAHAALANVMLQSDWDWRGTEAELRKAIELNPSYARAHKLLGHQVLSGALRRHEEGISETQLAVKLDPWSPSNQSGLGWAYYHAERFEDALTQFRKTWEMFPEQLFTGVGVAQCLMMLGHHDEAVSTLEKTAAMKPDNAYLQGFLAWTYGAAGLTDKARSVLEEIHRKHPENPPALPLAWGYTGLGDKEKALEWLEKAFENRDFDLLFMQAPEFRQLLVAEPRYQHLREKMKLEGPET